MNGLKLHTKKQWLRLSLRIVYATYTYKKILLHIQNKSNIRLNLLLELNVYDTSNLIVQNQTVELIDHKRYKDYTFCYH